MPDNSNVLDYTQKVNVQNRSSVDTYFKLTERPGDAKVLRKSKASFTIGEILGQINARNLDFIGVDGAGNHATFYIEDKQVRVYAGLESEDGSIKQEIMDEKAIIELFETGTLYEFSVALHSKILTIGEQQTLRDIIANNKVNAYDKIEYAKKYLNGEHVEVEKPRSPGRPKKTVD